MWNPFFLPYFTPSLLPFISPSFLSSYLLFIQPIFMESLISSSKCSINNTESCSRLTRSSVWRQMTMTMMMVPTPGPSGESIFKEVRTRSHRKWLELRRGASLGSRGEQTLFGWANLAANRAWASVVCSRQILAPVKPLELEGEMGQNRPWGCWVLCQGTWALSAGQRGARAGFETIGEWPSLYERRMG